MFHTVGALSAPRGISSSTRLKCGAVACEYQWNGIGGTKVRDLIRSPNYPSRPNRMVKLTSKFSMTMKGNNLGVMLEGFVLAPTSGAYTFSTRSDDSSEVWAATQPNTQRNLIKVVELNGCCRKVDGRRSVQWIQARTYYLRAYVKEGGGGEYLYVGMKVNGKEYFPIPISMFAAIGSVQAPPGMTAGTKLKCGAAVCE